MIKKSWPMWARILLSPLAFLGAMLSLPIIVILLFANEQARCEKVMNFWIPE